MINKLWLTAALLLFFGSAQSAFAFDFAYDMPQFQYGIHYKWNVGQWVEDSRWTPHYTNGLFDSMFVEAYVNQTYIPYDRAHVSYSGSMLSIVNQSIFDGTTWSGQQVDSFTYSGNRIQYQDVMVYKNGVLQTHNLFTHSYDGSGRRIERLEEDLYPGQRRNDDDWRYSYDASGRIDTIYDNDWDGTQWVYKAREVYLYGTGGELDTVVRQYYSSGSWAAGEIFVVNGTVVPTQSPSPDRSKLALPGYEGNINNAITSNPGAGGANHTWDFSSLSFTKVGTFAVVRPDTTPYFSSYPSSNYAMSITLNNLPGYLYFRALDTALEDLANGVGTPSPEIFLDPRTELVFPFSLGDSLVDEWQRNGFSPDPVTVRYDGYGTLVTPTRSYSVIRIAMDYGDGTSYYWYSLNPLFRVAIFSYNNNTLLTFESASSSAPNLTVPSSLLFDTLIGTSQTKSLTITNSGTASLMLPTLTLRNGSLFSLSDTAGQSIAPGGSVNVSLTFAPAVKGTFYDTLVIGPVDAPLAMVYLSGIGEMGGIEITKDTTMLRASVGGSDTEQVAITNHGNIPVMITVARVLNSPNDFAVQSLVDPLQIAAGQSANLSVYYSPTNSSPANSSATVSMSYRYAVENLDTTFVLAGSELSSGVSETNPNLSCFDLFPNPAKDFVVIANAEDVREVRFIDATGNVLLKQNTLASSQRIDISLLPSGSYIVECSHADGSTSIQRLNVRR